eukprot:197975-Amphidinium_carterae.1
MPQASNYNRSKREAGNGIANLSVPGASTEWKSLGAELSVLNCELPQHTIAMSVECWRQSRQTTRPCLSACRKVDATHEHTASLARLQLPSITAAGLLRHTQACSRGCLARTHTHTRTPDEDSSGLQLRFLNVGVGD